MHTVPRIAATNPQKTDPRNIRQPIIRSKEPEGLFAPERSAIAKAQAIVAATDIA